MGYSSLLGPVGGVMIVDYYFIRKQQLQVDELYSFKGRYQYSGGINYKAVLALLIGIVPNIPGFLVTINVLRADMVPAVISNIYHYAWFVGFLVSGLVYITLMKNDTPQRT